MSSRSVADALHLAGPAAHPDVLCKLWSRAPSCSLLSHKTRTHIEKINRPRQAASSTHTPHTYVTRKDADSQKDANNCNRHDAWSGHTNEHTYCVSRAPAGCPAGGPAGGPTRGVGRGSSRAPAGGPARKRTKCASLQEGFLPRCGLQIRGESQSRACRSRRSAHHLLATAAEMVNLQLLF